MMLARAGLLVMVAVDTAMIGHAGVLPLAHFGTANAIHIPALVVMIGLLTSVLILSSQAIGAGRPGETARIWLCGCGLAVTGGLFSGAFLWNAGPVLVLLDQPAELVGGAVDVLRAFSWGMPAICLYIACIFLLESLGRPKTGLAIITFGNVVNLVGNFLLIANEGDGLAEAAIDATFATSATRWVMGAIAFYCVWRLTRTDKLAIRGTFAEYRSVLKRMLRKGTPVALAQYLESSSFNGTIIFAGWIGASAVASMQISFNVLAIVFMLSLGIGTASAVEVGKATGAGDMKLVRQSGWTALGLNFAVTALLTPVIFFGSDFIATFYTDDPDLLPVASIAIAITGLILIVDGGQAVMTGALRGAGDVVFGTIAYLVAFGFCALPAAYWLGVHQGLETPGLLYGMMCGLVLLLIMLAIRFALITRDGKRLGD